MEKMLIDKYGDGLVELIIDPDAAAKGYIGMTLASGLGMGLAGGYKPTFYTNRELLIKYVNKEITEYPLVDNYVEEDYLYICTKSSCYRSLYKYTK